MTWKDVLEPDEVPPQWMWPHSEPIEEWFERVKADREAKHNTHGDTPAPGGMMENDLARAWKQ